MPISHTCWNSVCSAPNTISMPSGSLNSAFPTHIFSAPFNSFLFRNSISTWPCPLRRWGLCETCPHWWYPCYSTGNRVPHLQTLKRSKDDGGVTVLSCQWSAPGLNGMFGRAWMLLRNHTAYLLLLFIFLLLPKMNSLAFVSSSYCSPPEHIVGRLNTHNVTSPDSLTSIISVDQRVFCIQSSNLGQWNVQWRHYKAQFLGREKVYKSEQMPVYLYSCIKFDLAKGWGDGCLWNLCFWVICISCRKSLPEIRWELLHSLDIFKRISC